MSEAKTRKRGWARTGCFGIGGVALIFLVVMIGLSGFAMLQNRSENYETLRLDQPIPSGNTSALPVPAAPDSNRAPRGKVILDVAVCQATVVPGPPGSPIRVDGLFDPKRFKLLNEISEDADGNWTARIAMLPLGSEPWELFRLKMGGNAPRIRVSLPTDVPIEIEGSVRKALAALELGGLWVRTADFGVRGGNVELSFIEPTREPMQRIDINVFGGAMEVGPMGNASPLEVSLVQRFGALDLDLRGAWQQDGDVYIEGMTAGGSVWLPSQMRIEGLDRPPTRIEPSAEIQPLTLRLKVDSRRQQVLFIDELSRRPVGGYNAAVNVQPNAVRRAVHQAFGPLRFPYLFLLAAGLFLADLVIPDFIPMADEIMLGLLTLMLGSWRNKKQTPPPAAGSGRP